MKQHTPWLLKEERELNAAIERGKYASVPNLASLKESLRAVGQR